MPLHLRPAALPADAEAIARLLTEADPDRPMTPQRLLKAEAARDPTYWHRLLVAEADGEVVSMGSLEASPFDDALRGRIAVQADKRGHGLGSALFAALQAEARPHYGPQQRIHVQLGTGEHDAVGRQFVEARGAQVVHRRAEYVASLTAELAAVALPAGVRLLTLEQLQALGPHAERWLHELDWQAFSDVPLGISPTKRSFEQWRKEELEQPNLRPTLSFVALAEEAGVEAQTPTGPLLGYTLTGHLTGNSYYIDMTGVARTARGQGLARALKLAGMRAVYAAGGRTLKTCNDPANTRMLALNRSLGFEQVAEHLRYELRLGE